MTRGDKWCGESAYVRRGSSTCEVACRWRKSLRRSRQRPEEINSFRGGGGGGLGGRGVGGRGRGREIL